MFHVLYVYLSIACTTVIIRVYGPCSLFHDVTKAGVIQGSTVQREASDKEKAKVLPTYKDIDFLNEKMTIQIGEENKAKLMANLQADVQVSRVLHCSAM